MPAALKNALVYDGAYDYRQGFAFERELPQFLEDLITETHNGLSRDTGFGAECIISPADTGRSYRIELNIDGALITQRVNGEEEDTYRPTSRFEELGGIRDILAQIIEGGGLPATAAPHEVQVNYL